MIFSVIFSAIFSQVPPWEVQRVVLVEEQVLQPARFDVATFFLESLLQLLVIEPVSVYPFLRRTALCHPAVYRVDLVLYPL